MNKYQEALDWLKLSCDCIDDCKAVETLKELVDKETSKKPLEQGNQLSCLVKYAPNGRNINSHCYDCGGVLDWSEINE